MVDKLVKTVSTTRKNWYEAFKMSVNIKGYEYYEMPEEIRMRYPAPGSVPHDKDSYPHLYKKHWKTPFRDSNYNIRHKEKVVDPEVNTKHYISGLVEWDMEKEPQIAGQQKPRTDDLQLSTDHPPLDSEEMVKELWDSFEDQNEQMRLLQVNYSPYVVPYAQDYDQVQLQWRDRGANGMLNDARTREIFVELEYWIEDVIGAKQIREKKKDFYKGQPKKWQVLDDKAFDRDQVEKMQVAIQAPLPEELEGWVEKHKAPMTLPFNNENAAAWRDEPLAINSADFDPEFLQIDRERSKKFFLERYEKPKELTSGH